MCNKDEVCQRPKPKGKPGECSAEQVKDCHGKKEDCGCFSKKKNGKAVLDALLVNPVGIVHSPYHDPSTAPPHSINASIEVFPEYAQGLLKIEEHSHLWILSWFHKARRDLLMAMPRRMNRSVPEYGVFGLRAAGRPNPIGLSLVKLQKVENNILHVQGLDAIDGTPVIDIKTYFEQDIVFSPLAPYIRPHDKGTRYNRLLREAYNHHQEECRGFHLALRMAFAAQDVFSKLNSPDLKVSVKGPGCFADTIQGLFRARLANPARFDYKQSTDIELCLSDGTKELSIRIVGTPSQEELLDLDKTDFLNIQLI